MPTALGTIASSYKATTAGPIPMTGLQAWWDAADASTFTYSSGTVVSQWRDKSGNVRHLSQGTVASQPSRSGTQNGKSTVVFDGVNDRIMTSPFALPQPLTVVIALNAKSNGLYFCEPAGWGAFYATGYLAMRGTGAASTVSNFLTPDGIHVHVTEFATSSSALYRDGVKDGYISDVGTGSFTGFSLNENGGGYGGSSSIDVFEVIMYDRVLSTVERQQVESYLKTKWGTP